LVELLVDRSEYLLALFLLKNFAALRRSRGDQQKPQLRGLVLVRDGFDHVAINEIN
jgi:hypothetical protein